MSAQPTCRQCGVAQRACGRDDCPRSAADVRVLLDACERHDVPRQTRAEFVAKLLAESGPIPVNLVDDTTHLDGTKRGL